MAGEVQGHQATGGATTRGKPDPNVKLPGPVKAAADRAEALSKQAREAREANEASGVNQPIGETQRSVQVPTTKPFGAQGGQSGDGAIVTMATFDPRNPDPPTDVPGDPRQSRVQSQTTQPQSQQDWEHQFNSLKGRYEQETANNRRMAQQLNDTQRLLAQLSAPAASQPQGGGSGVRFTGPITGQGVVPQRRVTAQELTEYGADLMDVVGRRAQEVFEQTYLPQVIQELTAVKRQIGGVANTQVFDARVKMYDDLEKEVPNWHIVNDHPQFAAWLDQVDPMSGQLRRNLLNGAHNGNHTPQVVAIFKGFLSDAAAAGLQQQGQQPGNGAGGQTFVASTPQVDLLSLAAPGRAKTGQTTVPPEKPIFNRADITRFYHDKTHGRYAGREAEADALERSIIEASSEGRIR